VRTPDLVYWASAALMWLVTTLAYAYMRHWRIQLKAATADLQQKSAQASVDAPLADWCRHMNLTVTAHTGTMFSVTFAELQGSQHPVFRIWNVPKQIIVWSDRADAELLEAVPPAITPDDVRG